MDFAVRPVVAFGGEDLRAALPIQFIRRPLKVFAGVCRQHRSSLARLSALVRGASARQLGVIVATSGRMDLQEHPQQFQDPLRALRWV